MATLDQQREYKEAVARANSAFRSGNIAGARASSKSAEDILQESYGNGPSREQISTVDPYAEIKRQQEALLAAQKQQRINALGAQRQSALSSLEAERGTVAPVYLKQRGNLSTTAQQTARGAEQSLAARGLTRGGSAVQGDIARNVALQQGMADIGTAEAGTLANIAQRQTAAEQAYQQGLAQAESEAAATAAQNEIQRLMQAQQAQEATGAKQAEMDFEQQKAAQAFENTKAIEALKEAAQIAREDKDYTRERELNKQKSDLEKEQITLKASYDKSGGGGSKTPKVTEGQLNTLINNFSTMVSGNPYYKTGGAIYRKKRLDDYLNALGSKIQVGAIDPTTAQAMMQYVQTSPEYKALYGNQPL